MSNARFSIIQAKAVRDRRVTDSQLRTLNALGIYGDKDGWCFPKQSTLGEDVGKNQQNVSKDIQALVKLGYVESFPQWDKESGARMQNKYRLIFDTPLSSQRDDTPTPPRRVDNAPLNAPYNTMASGENQPSAVPDTYPVEWQIAGGKEEVVMPDEKDNQMRTSANLLAMGAGVKENWYFNLAYAFMKTRGIIIPQSKIKGNRKALKEMVEMNVQAIHVIEATKQLMAKNYTLADLYSVVKTAVALANPAPDTYEGAIDGV